MPVEIPPEELASRTIQRISDGLTKRQVAGVPEVIHLIQELSSKAFSITVKELSEIISQDVAVTAKVISAANTVGYNPMGVQVNTVSQAIQVIGFDRVRNLAISLLLVENAEQSMSAEEQREAAAFAVSSGLVAQSLMERFGHGDPEQAFVCASLRNYGRLLMTTFLLDDYRHAQSLVGEKGEDRAFREVFGLTPLELSYHLLLSSHLPKEILNSLQTLPSGMVHRTAVRPEDELLLLADFSVKLCETAMAANLGADLFLSRCREMSRIYGKKFQLKDEEFKETFQRVASRFNAFSQTYGIRTLSSDTVRCFAARADDKDPPPELQERYLKRKARPRSRASSKVLLSGESGQDSIAPGSAKVTVGEALQAPSVTKSLLSIRNDLLASGLDTLLKLIGERPVEYRRVQRHTVNIVRAALITPDVIFFDGDGDGGFSPTEGVGTLYESIHGRPGLIVTSRKDVTGISLTRREDVLIENALDPKIDPYIPLWMKVNAMVKSFYVMPVLDEAGPVALIIAARTIGSPIQLNSQAVQHLRAMRIHIATGRRLSSSSAAAL